MDEARPAQPQEYPGNLLAASPLLSRRYTDSFDRPLRGRALVRPEGQAGRWVELDEDGAFSVDLPPGRYRLMAELIQSDGRKTLRTEGVSHPS